MEEKRYRTLNFLIEVAGVTYSLLYLYMLLARFFFNSKGLHKRRYLAQSLIAILKQPLM